MQTLESTAQINIKSVTWKCQALCGWAVGLFSPVDYWLRWNSPQGGLGVVLGTVRPQTESVFLLFGCFLTLEGNGNVNVM